jgi:hypothetical protein
VVVWLHASPYVFADGDVISPPGDVRAPRWPGSAEAEERGWYRRDRVYIFWSDDGVPPGDHIGRFEFATEKSYLYEVEPIGDLETDPAGGGHDSWRCCVGARVLSCRHSPVSYGTQ